MEPPPAPVPTTVTVSPATTTLSAIGATVQLGAAVEDQNGDPMTGVTINWTSSDGAVATVDGDGTATARADGQATITATAGQASGTATVTVAQVAAGIAISPASANLMPTETQQFAASVTDANGNEVPGASASWSTVDAAVATVNGTGLVTAVADGQTTVWAVSGSDSASAAVMVATPNQSPTATIVAPSDGASFSLGDNVAFSGTGTDPEDGTLSGSSLVWVSSLDGQIGTGETFGTTSLSEGAHAIRLVATDAQGATGSASISITVTNQSPTATIVAPSDGASFNQGDNVAFSGTGTDPEDGTLSGSSLVWESSLDNQIGTGETFGTMSLSVGSHTIRLIATDSQGAADTATISITVDPVGNQSPSATLQTPGAGSEFSQGETVTFRGVASDFEDGSLTGGSLAWESSMDGFLGTGSGFTDATLSLGAHTIRLIATDSQGAADTATATITVVTVPSAMFDVDIRYTAGTTPTAAQQAAFDAAEARWEALILGDLPDVPLNAGAGSCGAGSPAINETVDDLIILVTLEPIDGSGGILGSAGPCFLRVPGSLTILGRMRFDTADLAGLEAAGQLDEVILHEMGHVLGIGSLWGTLGLRLGTGTSDPYFIGTTTLAAFENIGGFSYTGGNKVPVANTGGSGTRNVHWRESVFDDELMTGFLDGGVFNPLSIVTVNSLRDMGYVVDTSIADPLFLSLSLRMGPATKIELKDDVWRLPIALVDSSGRVTRVIMP